MLTRRYTWFVAAAAILATLAFLQIRPASSSAARAKRPVVAAADSRLGRILVDSRGHTLYLFEKDKKGMSSCAGSCATYWPPLLAAGKPVAAAGVKASLLGTAKRADGRLQVTYHGHPLYTFALDTKKGQTKGEDLRDFGAAWYAVSPAGTKVEPAGDASDSSGY